MIFAMPRGGLALGVAHAQSDIGASRVGRRFGHCALRRAQPLDRLVPAV